MFFLLLVEAQTNAHHELAATSNVSTCLNAWLRPFAPPAAMINSRPSDTAVLAHVRECL